MTRKLNKVLGFYIPSFFRLNVSIQNSIKDFNKLNDKDFSVFFHEYIHFIQDITTFYGLNCIHATVDYLKYANNFIVDLKDNSFSIPIEPDPTNSDNVLLNGYLCKMTYGDVGEASIKEIKDYTVSLLDINIPNSPIKEIESIDIEFIDGENETNYFSFGSGCIMESMAYLFEQLTCKDYFVSPDLPYNTAELLARKIYPEFAENKLNILALCDISLGISNPAKYFVRTIEKWKKRNEIPSKPEILYDDFKKEIFTLNGNKQEYHLQQIVDLAKDQLKGYFNDDIFKDIKEWIDNVIIEANLYRENNPYFILDFAKGNIKTNKKFKDFFHKIGTPLLTNDNQEFRFYHPLAYKKQIDIGFFWAINQIQDLFLVNKTSCDLIDFCKQPASNTIIDERCLSSPWQRCNDKELCPYAIIWKHWKLCNKSIEIK
jgi:hypothetical protein